MPKIIHFSGRDWTVKSSEEPVGPGPSFFSDSNEMFGLMVMDFSTSKLDTSTAIGILLK